MAFPSIAATNTTNGTTAATACVCNLPTGIVAGNLLVVVFRSASSASVTWPAEWTEAIDSAADASDDCFSIGWRRADGLTDGTTVTVTSSASAKFAATAYRINDWAQSINPVFTTVATGTSTTPNPGAATISATKDYLFIWTGGWEGEQTSPPAGNPTNYGLNVIGANSGTAGVVATNCRVAMAGRQLNTGVNEDPPTWTISASDDWMAVTVTVHPGANLGPVAANGVSSLTGDLTNTKHLEATANGVSSLTGDLTVETPGQAVDLGTVTCNGVSTLSTAATQPNITHPLEAIANGASSLATDATQPNVTHPLVAVSNGTSTLSTAATQPNVSHPLEVTSNGVSSMSGALQVSVEIGNVVANGASTLSTAATQPNITHPLAAVSNGASSTSTDGTQPNVSHSLDATANGTSTLNIAATQPNVTHSVEATTNGVSSLTGVLTVAVNVDLGTVVCNGTSSLNSAMLNVAVSLDGTANGVSTASTAATQPNVTHPLEVTANGTSSLSTGATQPNVSHLLDALANGVSSLFGDLTVVTTAVDLGNVTANGTSGMATAADQPHVLHALEALAAGVSLITGNLGITIDLGGGISNGVSTLSASDLTVSGVANTPPFTVVFVRPIKDVVFVSPGKKFDVSLFDSNNDVEL